MKRSEQLVEISRRDFCALAGCAGLAIAGCSDPPATTPDAGGVGPDASGAGATCPGGASAVDVGPPASFAMNAPTYFSSPGIFVARDAGGLYAVSAHCTHQGGLLIVASGHYVCLLHGAQFTFAGDIISGPVFTGLAHYAMCVLSSGHVGVSLGQQVAKTVRLVA